MVGMVAVVTSGCFITDLVTDIFKKPVLAGEWYNKDSNTYIALNDDGNFTMGYGKGNANTGGTYDYDKKEITLHLDYTIKADGTKEDWDQSSLTGGAGKIVMPYELQSNGSLKIKSEGGNLIYEKIGGESIETNLKNLVGTWDYEKGGLQLILTDDGSYTVCDDYAISDNDTKKDNPDQGSYTFSDGVLTLTINGSSHDFQAELVMKDRLRLENETGTFYYVRVKE
ncbi:hypothetical protein ACWI_10140 [Acetobacterium wieringae]|jgi:hypothetical protein|uniref:Uncharacterized protein n=2 Tax=Acetobacterium wieringae TaxID=52694 RepID=A0A1F2PKX0_9FIRM|nr:hypothetical protein ACWI_10140 [Acetobacterium wieringae]